MREDHRSGLDYLASMTALLQRVRSEDRFEGIYEAAEPQWWWSVPRRTDDLEQLFWFDDDGRPEASVVVHDFGQGSSALYQSPIMVVTVRPSAEPDWVAHVVERGLAHAAAKGFDAVELEVDRADEVLREILFGHGFRVTGDGMVECWLEADARPEVSPLHDGYRLLSRGDTTPGPHHMADPGRPEVEARLGQTSLYRPDLDLVVLDANDEVAAYGLFWNDPTTATGVVEPMRTHDDHRQRGLARHVLTAGIERLVAAGAERISIGYEPGNPASGPLYRSVGFEPHQQTDVVAGALVGG